MRKRAISVLANLILAACCAVANAQDAPPKYKDVSLTPEERAASLVSRLTLDEKVAQMQDSAPAVPRLGLPAYGWWNEALHGVARAGLATVFPQAIGLAATWDTDLEQRIGDVISTEARGKYNDATAHGQRGRYYGLTFWSPNINIFRDPRWGRGQETFGEDPFLTAEMALAFVHGMQGNDPHYFKTIATAKHFAVHSGPELTRHSFDARVTNEELDGTYLYAFRKTLGAKDGAYSVMCAYNRLEGAPACASDLLLKDKLRGEWKFPGYVVSDCGAVGDIFRGHHVAKSMPEAAAMAVHAGTDLTCGNEYISLVAAVQRGLIPEAEIDASLKRLFVAQIRLGMFDPPERVPYSHLGLQDVATPEHEKLALEAAEKSIVLLKNEGGLLPLKKQPARIAVVGPAADDPDVLLGNYFGTPRHLITPLEGIRQRFTDSQVSGSLGSVYAASSLALVPTEAISPAEGGGGHGVWAEYYANETFSGTPALSRVEPRGYFVWAMGDPAMLKALPEPSFSVRWRFTLKARTSGEYDLGVHRPECDSCPGSNTWRLTINGETIVDATGRAAGGNRTLHKSLYLESGKEYAAQVEYVQRQGGSGIELVWAPAPKTALADAVELAKQSDVVVACIGLNSRLEGEESPVEIPGFAHGDRTNIELPAVQEDLLTALLDTGKPVIVVLLNGSAVAVRTAKQRAAAILETWYGGQEGGVAIARTLAGDSNPGGRLPVTFYENVDQLPPFDDYSMRGRTYRFFTGQPLYPFGFGLSYAKFEYSKLDVKSRGVKVSVSVRVKNTSTIAGDEVAQMYVKTATGPNSLAGFKRVHLRAGESRRVDWTLDNTGLGGAELSVATLRKTVANH